jgi:hypothetical protein
MVNTVFLREFSQLLLKHGASLEDLIGMVYTQEELDPLTGKYRKYFDLITVKRDPEKYICVNLSGTEKMQLRYLFMC